MTELVRGRSSLLTRRFSSAASRETLVSMIRLRPFLAPALFVAPGMLLYLVFIVWPMLQAVAMSVFDYKAVAGATSEFLGLANYVRALNAPRVWLRLSNSGIYMLFAVPPQNALGLGVALLLCVLL